jgi:hypothetical protein
MPVTNFPYGIKTGTLTADSVETDSLALAGLTASVDELNLVDAAPAALSFVAAAGGANEAQVTVQVRDASGSPLAGVRPLIVWLTDEASGAGLTGTTASGAVTAASGGGTVAGTLTAKKALVVLTTAAGAFVLSITDTAHTAFRVAAAVLGSPKAVGVSAALQSSNYGSGS